MVLKCLEVMSFTTKELEADFRAVISKTSRNGIFQTLWARRSDMLCALFKNSTDWQVLHIKRGLWQFDPIFNAKTGELIVFFSKVNFRTIRNRYFRYGFSTHYSLSLLLKNEGLYPEHKMEQLSLSLFGDEYDELSQKQIDLERMLGTNCENVTRVRFLVVDYVDNEAVSASLEDYTPQLVLANSVEVSHLLPVVAGTISTTIADNGNEDFVSNEPQLVTLKSTVKGL